MFSSAFGRLLLGAFRSNTNQFNGLLAVIWTALYQSDFIQQDPEVVAILGGLQALVNIFLRFKTKKPLADR